MARPSTIDKLPDEIKSLIAQLRHQNVSIDDILEHLQKLNVDVSRSALGRHSKKLDEVAETMKKSQLLATTIADKFGNAESSKVARFNFEMLNALLMKMMIGDDDKEEISLDPKEAMFLATALEKLSKAEKTNVEAQIKVAEERARQEATTAAAEVAVKEARKQGLSAATVNSIKSKILGVE